MTAKRETMLDVAGRWAHLLEVGHPGVLEEYTVLSGCPADARRLLEDARHELLYSRRRRAIYLAQRIGEALERR